MRVVIDVNHIKGKVKELLIVSYGLKEGAADEISNDIETILKENEDD